MTIAEYLAFEETSEERHEYHDGEVFAMSGGTVEHGRVCRNLTIMLGNRLRGSGCENFDSNMRVAVSTARRFVYPDATVVCGPPKFHEGDPKRTTIVNPRVVFEVLSESTEGYDRGDKFDQYRRIESLEEVILIGRTSLGAQGFLRQDDGTWSLAAWDGIGGLARIRCLDLKLPLSELYEGVEFQ